VVNRVSFLNRKDTLAAVRRTAGLASQPAVGPAEHEDVTGQAKGSSAPQPHIARAFASNSERK